MKQEVVGEKKLVPLDLDANFFYWRERGYINTLREVWLNKLIDNEITEEEFNQLNSIEENEYQWKESFLVSLAEIKLIRGPKELTHEEIKHIIAMTVEEGNEWRDKLTTERREKIFRDTQALRAKGEAIEKAKPLQFRAARRNERTVSMEVKMLPPVREAAKQLATTHGMTAQEYVEYLLVESLNKNLEQIKEGKKRLQKFNGSTVAAKRYTQEEELSRLRSLQQESSTPSR